MYVENNIKRVRVTTVRGKVVKVLNIMCVYILALVIQHAKRMRRIILAPVACLAVPYFFHITS
jgi:hypothetical protein